MGVCKGPLHSSGSSRAFQDSSGAPQQLSSLLRSSSAALETPQELLSSSSGAPQDSHICQFTISFHFCLSTFFASSCSSFGLQASPATPFLALILEVWPTNAAATPLKCRGLAFKCRGHALEMPRPVSVSVRLGRGRGVRLGPRHFKGEAAAFQGKPAAFQGRGRGICRVTVAG